jgi:hypothetical protein
MAFEHSDWLPLTGNSEAIVTAQSSSYYFSKKMAENQMEVNYLCKLY